MCFSLQPAFFLVQGLVHWYCKQTILSICHIEALFYLITNVCHFLPRVGGQVSECCMYHKLADKGNNKGQLSNKIMTI